MNTPTPTPRTDAATYPADCLGKTLVTNRDCSRELERELTALTAERDELRAEVERLKFYIATTIQPDEYAKVIKELRAEVERYRLVTLRQDAELATEREKVRVLRSALENLCDEQNGAGCGCGCVHWVVVR